MIVHHTWLAPLQRAVESINAPVDFFFRDDDVGWETDRLFPLLDVFAQHATPVDLAVIPDELTPSLARQLLVRAADSPAGIGFHQHGFAHRSHEHDGKKSEFGASRSYEQQRTDLVAGQQRLQELLRWNVAAIFSPPWNRCTGKTVHCLVELGFGALSGASHDASSLGARLVELPVTVDWFSHRSGSPGDPTHLAELLAASARADRAVGVMLHHALIDAEERRLLGELLGFLSSHHLIRCRRMWDLVDQFRNGVMAHADWPH